MEIRLIKIMGCQKPHYWYAGMIGQKVKVKTTNEAGKLALLENEEFIIDESDTKTLLYQNDINDVIF